MRSFKVHDKVSQQRANGSKDFGMVYEINDSTMPISVRMNTGTGTYVSDYKPEELVLEENTEPWQELLLAADGIVRGHSGDTYETYYVLDGQQTRVMVVMDDGEVHSNIVESIETYNMMFIQRYSTGAAVRRRKINSLLEKSGVA